MLRRLGSRFLPALLPLGLSAAMAVAGCEASTTPDADPTQVELRDSGPSAWIIEQGDEIADAIVADPAFEQLVSVATGIMGDMHAAQQKLPDEEIDSIARTINEPWFSQIMAPGELLGHLGGDPEDLQTMRSLIEHLRTKHGLQEASPEDVGYVFELAIATDGAQQIMTAAVGDELAIDSGDDWDQCTAACYAIYMAGLVIALGFFIAAMAVAVVTFPWGLILAAVAIAVFDRAVAELQAALAVCLAECDGTVGDLDFCGDWDVCEEDEYCWTGILGIGDDECRPKKENGKVCSKHEKCLSGCCKYHFPSHPVSKVCRPASKCN